MNFIPTEIPDVTLIEPRVFGDERGFFMETFQQEKFKSAGIDHQFVQDNHSRSIRGTLRGLHYQIRHTQGKLVRVVLGEWKMGGMQPVCGKQAYALDSAWIRACLLYTF